MKRARTEGTSSNGESFILTGNAQALAKYPHMRAVNGLLFVSGVSSRRLDNTYAGVHDNGDGTFRADIREQTRAVLENIQRILAAADASLSHCVDMTCFLVNMQDYAGFNEVYNEFFPVPEDAPARTTVAVKQLPNPDGKLLIEIKAVAADPRTGCCSKAD